MKLKLGGKIKLSPKHFPRQKPFQEINEAISFLEKESRQKNLFNSVKKLYIDKNLFGLMGLKSAQEDVLRKINLLFMTKKLELNKLKGSQLWEQIAAVLNMDISDIELQLNKLNVAPYKQRGEEIKTQFYKLKKALRKGRAGINSAKNIIRGVLKGYSPKE